MLLITRRRGEKLTIGDNVEVTLVGFRNGAAQIGIVAPKNVTVLRNELMERPTSPRHVVSGAQSDDNER
ncbi:carbon storage regulator [Rhodanobacter sp. B2A1Ga4]|uniref:carbon storage regulator n=1 Tax=Rhodanobacter sp. B2A1Ga4 TaxID=2778647 RepID=UPI001B388FC8|nr:carbon storage regulator [Rhodanobacter sp. B2A1Ga4]MBQ4855735.1 carbon storage regulator [Rhodanobacter sp. B2A1Ga4]